MNRQSERSLSSSIIQMQNAPVISHFKQTENITVDEGNVCTQTSLDSICEDVNNKFSQFSIDASSMKRVEPRINSSAKQCKISAIIKV